jgi:hypothetical protein
MKSKTFFSLFDKERFMFVLRIILIFLAIVIAFNLINFTYSKFASGANSNAKADIAFFVVDVGNYSNTLELKGLTPSDTPYLYHIDVSNFKDNKKANVNLTYTINFTATTNLPLTYQIVRNENYGVGATNIITKDQISTDVNGVYYRNLSTDQIYSFSYDQNHTDNYTLVVNFPSSYSNNPDAYQNLIDLFSVTIEAKQVV